MDREQAMGKLVEKSKKSQPSMLSSLGSAMSSGVSRGLSGLAGMFKSNQAAEPTLLSCKKEVVV